MNEQLNEMLNMCTNMFLAGTTLTQLLTAPQTFKVVLLLCVMLEDSSCLWLIWTTVHPRGFCPLQAGGVQTVGRDPLVGLSRAQTRLDDGHKRH